MDLCVVERERGGRPSHGIIVWIFSFRTLASPSRSCMLAVLSGSSGLRNCCLSLGYYGCQDWCGMSRNGKKSMWVFNHFFFFLYIYIKHRIYIYIYKYIYIFIFYIYIFFFIWYSIYIYIVYSVYIYIYIYIHLSHIYNIPTARVILVLYKRYEKKPSVSSSCLLFDCQFQKVTGSFLYLYISIYISIYIYIHFIFLFFFFYTFETSLSGRAVCLYSFASPFVAVSPWFVLGWFGPGWSLRDIHSFFFVFFSFFFSFRLLFRCHYACHAYMYIYTRFDSHVSHGQFLELSAYIYRASLPRFAAG